MMHSPGHSSADSSVVLDQVVGDAGHAPGAIGSLLAVEDHRPVEVLGLLLHHPQPVVATQRTRQA